MKDIQETRAWRISGFPAFVVEVAIGIVVWKLLKLPRPLGRPEVAALVALLIVGVVSLRGFFVVHPNEAKALVFFGTYAGSVRLAGFHWSNPFATRKAISIRVRNFNSETIKVNDESGNPIEIGAVVVWLVTDSAKALFNVEDYESFVSIQAETAIRNLASHHPYDADDALSLRSNPDLIAVELKEHLTDRLSTAGMTVVEARISHLAYAPEIAQTMLRRQQAAAVIAARRLIVEGAVGMVKDALTTLEETGVVKLDEERRAAMVNNLLVSLVSESQSQPVINTGTLYA